MLLPENATRQKLKRPSKLSGVGVRIEAKNRPPPRRRCASAIAASETTSPSTTPTVFQRPMSHSMTSSLPMLGQLSGSQRRWLNRRIGGQEGNLKFKNKNQNLFSSIPPVKSSAANSPWAPPSMKRLSPDGGHHATIARKS